MSDMPEVIELYQGPMVIRTVGYCTEGPFAGWIMAKHPDGQWVSIAKVPAPRPSEPAAPSPNRFGVDTEYFRRELAKLSESLDNRPGDELARYLRVLAEVAAPALGSVPPAGGVDEAFDAYWGDSAALLPNNLKDYARGVWAAACAYSRIRLSAELASTPSNTGAAGLVLDAAGMAPCPFCGERGAVSGLGEYQVGCRTSKCVASVYNTTRLYSSSDKAVAEWNKRAALAAGNTGGTEGEAFARASEEDLSRHLKEIEGEDGSAGAPPTPLTWTREKPKVPGWYFRRICYRASEEELERKAVHYSHPVLARDPAVEDVYFEYALIPEPKDEAQAESAEGRPDPSPISEMKQSWPRNVGKSSVGDASPTTLPESGAKASGAVTPSEPTDPRVPEAGE